MRSQKLAVLFLIRKEWGCWREGGEQAELMQGWLIGPSLLFFHIAALPVCSSAKLGFLLPVSL